MSLELLGLCKIRKQFYLTDICSIDLQMLTRFLQKRALLLTTFFLGSVLILFFLEFSFAFHYYSLCLLVFILLFSFVITVTIIYPILFLPFIQSLTIYF